MSYICIGLNLIIIVINSFLVLNTLHLFLKKETVSADYIIGSGALVILISGLCLLYSYLY